MRNDFRAKQFLPFDSLAGFYDMLKKYNNKKEDRILLLEDESNFLDLKIRKLKKGDKVLVKHYYNLNYVESILVIKKIDMAFKVIYFNDCKIFIDDILDIDIL